ncbi:O-methyltransferase [Aspergillus luchuensis]|uniref:O-methyltransferase n=1 Tax=Aspergillus kawachii TaxID=1069201 RepID=A0A146FSL3_ASPKA|nr:O-methyltransferase [Aspergillus luchuensis]
MTISNNADHEPRELDKALGTLNNAAAECRVAMTCNTSDSVECHSAVHGARQKLIVETLKFLQVVQGPVDTVQSWFDKIHWYTSSLLISDYAGRMDEHMPTHLKMHDFLAYNGWKSPDSVSNNPYTYTHETGGKGMFQHLASYPSRMEAFNKGMTMQAMTSGWMLDVYPFKKVISDQTPATNDPVAVDIGGGKGRAIRQIRSLCDGLPGRYILEDQEHVIRSIVPPPDGIEMVPHDFFTEQPVKGALIYLIRRCLHNWPPSKVTEILKKTVAAMEVNKSRLLIEEILVPQTKAGIEEGWMDVLMMSLGGKQRTIEEWRTVLAEVGLRVGKVYQVPGSCNGIIEAWRV